MDIGPGTDRLSGETRARIKATKPVYVEPVPMNPLRDSCRVGMQYREMPAFQTKANLLDTRRRENVSLLHRTGMRQVLSPPTRDAMCCDRLTISGPISTAKTKRSKEKTSETEARTLWLCLARVYRLFPF